MLTRRLREFIKLEAASGIILLSVLLIALFIANTPLKPYYTSFINTPVQIRIGVLDLNKPAFLWVNDGFIAVFFLLLALEIKREVLDGELSKRSQLILPTFAALGGIVLPALIYLSITQFDPTLFRGWPIAVTTDIAFALGVVALLSKRVPSSLKVFLVALSIVDDILAIAIIAIQFTHKIHLTSLILGGIGLLCLILFNIVGIKRIAAYILVGIVMWVCILKAGIHATLAGVLVGFAIPLRDVKNPNINNHEFLSPLRHLEHILHPWVAFFILPTFVFMNGGIPLLDIEPSQLLSAVPVAIALGLSVGKTFGILGASFLIIKLKWSQLPSGANWIQLLGISAIAGIGFTMSLFITSLAFHDTAHATLARQGVLIGSLLSGLIAVMAFYFGHRRKQFVYQNKSAEDFRLDI